MNQREEVNVLLVELIQLRGDAEKLQGKIKTLEKGGREVPVEMLYASDNYSVRIQKARARLKQLRTQQPIDFSKVIGIIGPETLKQEPAERVRLARQAVKNRR